MDRGSGDLLTLPMLPGIWCWVPSLILGFLLSCNTAWRDPRPFLPNLAGSLNPIQTPSYEYNFKGRSNHPSVQPDCFLMPAGSCYKLGLGERDPITANSGTPHPKGQGKCVWVVKSRRRRPCVFHCLVIMVLPHAQRHGSMCMHSSVY